MLRDCLKALQFYALSPLSDTGPASVERRECARGHSGIWSGAGSCPLAPGKLQEQAFLNLHRHSRWHGPLRMVLWMLALPLWLAPRAQAADPQPYTVNIHSTGISEIGRAHV